MSYYLSAAFSFSIAIAAITGWIRLKRLDPVFFPFLILVTLATINETISFLIIYKRNSNAINTNIYTLLEAFIITWQFQKWGLFNKHRKLFYLLLLLFASIWSIENFYTSAITSFNSYFIIVYGFFVAMMSISMVNLLLNLPESQLMKPILLICFCFSIFYSYNTLIEVFWIWGLDASKSFRLNVYRILYYINFLTNIAYALAILWIPKKREFIRLS